MPEKASSFWLTHYILLLFETIKLRSPDMCQEHPEFSRDLPTILDRKRLISMFASQMAMLGFSEIPLFFASPLARINARAHDNRNCVRESARSGEKERERERK